MENVKRKATQAKVEKYEFPKDYTKGVEDGLIRGGVVIPKTDKEYELAAEQIKRYGIGYKANQFTPYIINVEGQKEALTLKKQYIATEVIDGKEVKSLLTKEEVERAYNIEFNPVAGESTDGLQVNTESDPETEVSTGPTPEITEETVTQPDPTGPGTPNP